MPRRPKDPSADARPPCPHRRKELRDGILMDWCYAIGFERLGDLPCEYCVEHFKPRYNTRARPRHGRGGGPLPAGMACR